MGFRPRQRKHQGTLWHQGFAQLITERAPSNIRVLAEFLLSLHPRRADLLLLQREGMDRRDHEARVLRGLWPRLGQVTLVEFKSPSRGFREGDLAGLVSYGLQLLQSHRRELDSPGELTLVLVVPDLTPTLQDELDFMQWRLGPLEDGYARVEGVMYSTYVAFTNQVSEAERDDYLRIFSQLRVRSPAAMAWFRDWMMEQTTMANIQKHEDYDEVMAKLLDGLSAERRLRIIGLTPQEILRAYTPEEILRAYTPEEILGAFEPEERLAGLAPEERLAGLAPEQRILALADEDLRGLPDDYIRSLPRSVQQAIRRRLTKKKGKQK